MAIMDVGGDASAAPIYTQGDTAANIISDALTELGVITSDIANPYASTEQNVILACRLLKNLGRQLWREHNWSHLIREASFTTVAAQGYYSPPSAFGRLLDGTAWDRTAQLPLGGPLSGPEWQALAARNIAPTSPLQLRYYKGQLWLSSNASTPADSTIYYEYITRFWVLVSGQTDTTLSAPTAGTDTIWFDPHLVKLGLKLEWLKAKGFDSAAAQTDFERALRQITGEDMPGAPLSLSMTSGERLLGDANLPDTGYGS